MGDVPGLDIQFVASTENVTPCDRNLWKVLIIW